MTSASPATRPTRTASPTAAAHADAVAVLGAWAPPDAGQRELRSRYLEHLAAHPDALDRGGPPAHLTASALVLDEAREHVLLVLHRRGRFWVQPGGHVEAGDATLAAAALREAREETGVDVALRGGTASGSPAPADLHHHALGAAFGRCEAHLDVTFLAVAARDAVPAVSAESTDVAWWPVRALPGGVVADLPARLRRAVLLVPDPLPGTGAAQPPSVPTAAAPPRRSASAEPSR